MTERTTQGESSESRTRIEVFWPTEGEGAGRVIGVRQLAFAEGLGEYPLKTIYVPLDQAAEVGASLLVAGQQAARRTAGADRRRRERAAARLTVLRAVESTGRGSV